MIIIRIIIIGSREECRGGIVEQIRRLARGRTTGSGGSKRCGRRGIGDINHVFIGLRIGHFHKLSVDGS